MRPIPLPDADTAFYWDAAKRHELHILRCGECGFWIHYPKPACPSCGSDKVGPQRVSGNGIVHTYTVTHRDVPGFSPPFVVALVELDEQRGLRVVTNIDGDVEIGMPVEVYFADRGEITVPMFRRRT